MGSHHGSPVVSGTSDPRTSCAFTPLKYININSLWTTRPRLWTQTYTHTPLAKTDSACELHRPSTMVVGTRNFRTFCWINMLTPEPKVSMSFYSTLLGWTFEDMPDYGHVILVDGKQVGGLFDLNAPSTPEGTKPVLAAMAKVENADQFADKVVALGGKVKPAFDVGEQGRMLVCYDPVGAEFDAWEPKSMHGTEVDSLLHGAPTWFETITTDGESISKFYTSLFGWETTCSPGPPPYTTFTLNKNPVAGLFQVTPEMGTHKPSWATYMSVDDVDETARTAEKLGATLCIPPRDIPEIGRFCGIISPQGVFFYAITFLADLSNKTE
jgi:uncharacterized protein